jgi:hypothetical protein
MHHLANRHDFVERVVSAFRAAPVIGTQLYRTHANRYVHHLTNHHVEQRFRWLGVAPTHRGHGRGNDRAGHRPQRPSHIRPLVSKLLRPWDTAHTRSKSQCRSSASYFLDFRYHVEHPECRSVRMIGSARTTSPQNTVSMRGNRGGQIWTHYRGEGRCEVCGMWQLEEVV